MFLDASVLNRVAQRFSALANPQRLAILYLLEAKEKLSFIELEKLLEMNPNQLFTHIGKLIEVDLVDNEKRIEENSKKNSFYHLTDLGKHTLSVLRNLSK